MVRGGHQRHIPAPVKEIFVTISSSNILKGRIDPVYLALVYPTNKHMAELQREPSCSIVSQLTVTSYKNRNTGVKISLVWYGAAS